MANNSVSFNIKLNVDGKERIVQASAAVDQLRDAINRSKSACANIQEVMARASFAYQGLQSAVSGIASSLDSLTAESRSFGGAMAAANTMAGKGGEELANLKDQVSELSKTIPIARDELANGLYQVISNGVPEDNWISYLEQSAKASVGGIADLGETVKVTSTIIKNYGLEWDNAGDIQDKIQLTAKNGVTSFEQLAQALPRVTSNAATLGVSIDELMATFSTLTGVSGNTAEVSTQLAAIFTALIKPSSEATEMAQKMGIQFDAAAIKAAGGMSQFLASLDKSVKQYAATSGVLEQEVYGKLFGSAESLRAITPLTNQLADKFKENVEEMQNSAGTIDEAFDTMSSTGSATLQMINNKLGEYTDIIQSSIGNVTPYINAATQISMMGASVATIGQAFLSVSRSAKVAAVAVAAYNKAAAIALGLSTAPLLAMAASLGVLAASYLGVKSRMEDTDRAARNLRTTIADMKKQQDDHVTAIRKYLPVAQDATKSTKDRRDAIIKLKSLYPEYFKNLDIATAKQYDIEKAVNAANRAYRDQLVLIAKQAKMKYEESKANYDKNQTGAMMVGTTPGMTVVMNQQEKAEVEANLKLWKEAEKAVSDYDGALKKVKPQKPQVTPPSVTLIPTKADTTSKTTTAKTPKEPDPLEGSIDWYEKAIDEKRKQLEATANATTRKQLQNEIEGLQRTLGMMKVEAGIDVVPRVEVKKNERSIIQKIDEDLKNFIDKFQPIEIPIEVKDIDRVKELGNINFSNLDSVKSMLENIKQITDPAAKSMAIAGTSCEALGSAMQQLGADSAAAKAGMMMAAIGQLVLSFTQAMTDASKNWVTWLAFGITGSAQLASLIGMVSRFATGGIVGGNQKSGDNVLVRVNSGEMILNAAQQSRLFALANGASVQVQSQRLQGLMADRQEGRHLDISLKLRGRDLVAAVANETRTNSRRSNIR